MNQRTLQSNREKHNNMSRRALLTASIGVAALLIFTTAAAPMFSQAAFAQLATGPGMTTTTAGGSNNATANTSIDEGRRLTLLGALGVSLVRGVQVTGTVLDNQHNQVTVTMTSSSTNATGTNTNATAPAVTAVAIRGQLDVINILQHRMMAMHGAGMMMEGSSAAAVPQGTMTDSLGGVHSTNSSGASMFDVKSFIDKLQIGSAIVLQGWTSPQQITVPIVAGVSNTTSMSAAGDTEIVLVLIVPYTQVQGAQAAARSP